MDVRFLKSLVAVVETGSIAAAARRESRTAAAISQRVQALERLLGCTLLLRTAHAARPSDQCLLILPKIRAIIELAQDLQSDLHPDGLAGELTIGAISTALTGVLPTLIERLALAAPDLKLKITPGDSKSLYEKVLAGELDAAILVRPPFQPPKALALVVLKVEPLILVAPAAYAGSRWKRCCAFIRSFVMTHARGVGRLLSATSMNTPSSPTCCANWMRWKRSSCWSRRGWAYRWCRSGPG